MVNNYMVLRSFVEKILNVSTSFIGESDVDKHITSALKDVGEFSKVDRICILLLKGQGKSLKCSHKWSNPKTISKFEMSNINISSIPWVMREITKDNKVKINNLNKVREDAKKELSFLCSKNSKSILILPIKDKENILGVIGFEKIDKPKKWSKFDIYLFNMFIDMLSIIFEKHKILNVLEDKKTQYKEIFKRSINPIILSDTEGNFIDYNDAALKFFETTSEEIKERKIWDYYLPHLKEKQKYKFIEDTKNTIVENKFYINGKIKTFIFNKFSVNEKGKVQYYSIGQDLTHLKNIEYNLHENKQLYKSLYDYNMDLIFSIDLKGTISMANPRVESLLGFSQKEIIGKYFTEFLPPSKLINVLGKFNKVKDGEAVRFEVATFRKNGDEILLDVQGVPIIVNNIIKGVYVIARDITKVRESDIELKNY
ncbi:PAS domain S-box protein [Clostridium sp. D2Q-11]|uniref:PAS domain S-box protein n=1 Tax=Anaeromonas frigoriresistens TaxID=2683708 RepID=A0A942URZ1_9FIRM|nr:PAS domain S-box protein [Anaeromonas frigoriresistens]MBS4538154.1 PAS domain S-box protein [Anaeromonas frigoriresistens]